MPGRAELLGFADSSKKSEKMKEQRTSNRHHLEMTRLRLSRRREHWSSNVDILIECLTKLVQYLVEPMNLVGTSLLVLIVLILGALSVTLGHLARGLMGHVLSPWGIGISTYTIEVVHNESYPYLVPIYLADGDWEEQLPMLTPWDAQVRLAALREQYPETGWSLESTKEYVPCYQVKEMTAWNGDRTVSACYFDYSKAVIALNAFQTGDLTTIVDGGLPDMSTVEMVQDQPKPEPMTRFVPVETTTAIVLPVDSDILWDLDPTYVKETDLDVMSFDEVVYVE